MVEGDMGTPWEDFFGNLKVIPGSRISFNVFDENTLLFSPDEFPLEAEDPEDEAEAIGFERVISGHEARAWLKDNEFIGASLWAQGRFLRDHPDELSNYLIGIGAEKLIRYSNVFFARMPIFYRDENGLPSVGMCTIDEGVKLDTCLRLLIRKRSA